MRNWKRIINNVARLAFATFSLSLLLAACSKAPPPSQPPVVINFNNGGVDTKNLDTKKTTPDRQVENQATSGGPIPTTAQQQQPPQAQDWALQGQQPVYNNTTSTPTTPALQTPAHQTTGYPYGPGSAYQVERLDEASFFNTQIHEIAMQLLRNFRNETGPSGPVAVATFVDLNNLYRTSPFGRYIAEQLMGELQRAGFSVVEIRKTDALMIKPRFGEYGLSRDIQEIARQSSARYVLTGTYVTRGRYVLVNARLVSNEDNIVASSGLKILRRDPFLNKLLWPSTAPGTTPAVRVPVKELGSLSDIKILSGS